LKIENWRREQALEPGDHGENAAVVLRADGEGVGKAETRKLRGARRVLVQVDLVDREQQRLGGAAQHFGEILVERREAVLAVDDKEQDIRRGERDLHFRADLIGKARIDLRADAAGINNLKWIVAELAERGNAVAGDTRHIVHDGDFASREAIEERGLADIGPTDDGNSAGHD